MHPACMEHRFGFLDLSINSFFISACDLKTFIERMLSLFIVVSHEPLQSFTMMGLLSPLLETVSMTEHDKDSFKT